MIDNGKRYMAALYMRLSKDDDGMKESSSISTQRKMLQAYAKEQGFFVYGEYIDDGWSGTNFDRPAWKQLIADIEEKKINLVITKDLSRLGRDYISAGQFTEIYFPSKGIRYIAINDGYDSASPCTDIAPFKNIINEMYARDISKKIRSAFHTKMEEGAFIGNFPPYGYQKDPADKNHLLPDKYTAPIIKKMFSMASEGKSPSQIACAFNEQGILTPLDYRRFKLPYRTSNDTAIYKRWTSSTVCKMLSNMVYLGYMIQGKTTKASFKSPVTIQNPSSEWIVVRDMHEPLITPEMFSLVKGRAVSRKKTPRSNFSNLFSGIAKCADCGRNMSTSKSHKKEGGYHLVCGAYKLYGACQCSNHSIDYDILYQVVLKELQKLLVIPPETKELFLRSTELTPHNLDRAKKSDEITFLKQRESELDGIIAHLYEDSQNGKLECSRFYRLLSAYENEQKCITSRLQELAESNQVLVNPIVALQCQKGSSLSNSQSVLIQPDSEDLATNVLSVTELTTALLHKTIDRIEIGQGYFEEGKKKGHRQHTIKIYYKFHLTDKGIGTA